MTAGEADDPRLDALFDLAPEDFVAARDRLARTLRTEGDRARAGTVKKLRRPTVVAWALNQLVRRDPDALTELLAATDELRQAQRKVLSGLGPGALREAGRRRRSVVDRLSDRVASVLGERGDVPVGHVQAARRALEAASVDAGAAAELRAGRLSSPPEPASGFGDVAGLVLVPDGGPAGAAGAAAGEGDGGGEEAARRHDEATRQRADAQEAERQRAMAEEAERQRAMAEEAERQRALAERERAAERLEEANAAAGKARGEARERRREADEADRDAEAAEAAVDRLRHELDKARVQARRSRERAGRAEAAAREAVALAERREQERAAVQEALDRLGKAPSTD